MLSSTINIKLNIRKISVLQLWEPVDLENSVLEVREHYELEWWAECRLSSSTFAKILF